MGEPKFPLGVDLMDADHARIEEMLAGAPAVGDGELAGYLARCRDEIAGHFAREEELMRHAGVPVLACHIAQHRGLIAAIDTMLTDAPDTIRLRLFIERDLPNLVMAHIASVDQVSARFIKGELPAAMTDRLRLPEEAL